MGPSAPSGRYPLRLCEPELGTSVTRAPDAHFAYSAHGQFCIYIYIGLSSGHRVRYVELLWLLGFGCGVDGAWPGGEAAG